MSMNLSLSLHGVWLDKLYQTPTSITYWCVEQRRWAKRNPALKKANRFASPRCSTQQCYYKYENWCWQLAHSWCEQHQPYSSDPYTYAGYTVQARIVSRGQKNKDTYNDMRRHLLEVRTLLAAGATFIVT